MKNYFHCDVFFVRITIVSVERIGEYPLNIRGRSKPIIANNVKPKLIIVRIPLERPIKNIIISNNPIKAQI